VGLEQRARADERARAGTLAGRGRAGDGGHWLVCYLIMGELVAGCSRSAREGRGCWPALVRLRQGARLWSGYIRHIKFNQKL
jgi:hypothetical protein